MKKKDLERITSMNDSHIKYCKVLNQTEHSITFEVDDNLEIGDECFSLSKGENIINHILSTEQIEAPLSNIIASSFGNKKLIDIGSDVLYKTIITCYGQHRPLVLSPDMIWLLIAQTLAKHIDKNAEQYRDKIVGHSGKMDIIVESPEDLLRGKPDWSAILDDFYDKIKKKTKWNIASNIVADFSTTGVNEKIASVATLMHGVQSYFRYVVAHCICGIPSITLKGNKEDWENVLKKSLILKRFGLETWYSWLHPILNEFIKASAGEANREFWKKMVRIKTPIDCPAHAGCMPDYVPIDGWCAALFPHKDIDNPESNRTIYDWSYSIQRMESETLRVGFKYLRLYPDGRTKSYPMELWSGMVGTEEDPETHSLTPVIGWFVRKSDEEKESLERLKGADSHRGIVMRVDTVPDILNQLENIRSLNISFTGKVDIPDWMYNKKIEELEIHGDIDEECKAKLERAFPNAMINKDNYYEDDDEEPQFTGG